MTALIVSNVALWIALVCVVLVCLVLARQVGILYERIAPMGALSFIKGPAVGEAAPQFELTSLTGETVKLGYPGQRSQLVFFVSPTCPVCKKMLPILKSAARRERAWLDVVLASDGDMPAHLALYHRLGLEAFAYVLSRELGLRYEVSKLPYAVLVDETGTVRAKGLINSREHLESLFTAKEIGVATAQDWLRKHQAATSPRVVAVTVAKPEDTDALV